MRDGPDTTNLPWHRRPPSARTRVILITTIVVAAAAVAVATWGALPWRWDFVALDVGAGIAVGALAHVQRSRVPVAALVVGAVFLIGVQAHVVPRMFGARAMSGSPATHASALTVLWIAAGLLLFRLGLWARARRSATHG